MWRDRSAGNLRPGGGDIHGYPADDPRIAATGYPEIAERLGGGDGNVHERRAFVSAGLGLVEGFGRSEGAIGPSAPRVRRSPRSSVLADRSDLQLRNSARP